ncbi:unnamed protein product [Alopecurus aequalis]
MLKIDLAKAFDRLEWSFICSALARKGLHGHFINLVRACITSPTFAVLINGQASDTFVSTRGIRQGCPLSPTLFILAINELSLTLQEALQDNHLTGIKLGPNCPPIHSLLFADDLLVCGDASILEATRIKQLLDAFCRSSGQFPNWSKSGILFSKHVPPQVAQDIRSVFPVPLTDASFLHLGHPLILPAKNRSDAYSFILDKFKNKLNNYKANSLSHAARLELINSVFSSIPVYYMSNLIFPTKFIAKITAIIRQFWWVGVSADQTRKPLCLLAWKDICLPKKEGGLGIHNLRAVNLALMISAAWRIARQPDSHIYKVLQAKYFHDSSIWKPKPNVPKSAFWSSILKVIPLLQQNSFYQITSGNISIWSTPWCDSWTRMYDDLIIQEPHFVYPAMVKHLWIQGTKTWSTSLIDALFTNPTAEIIKNNLVINSQEEDILCWKPATNGVCTSKSAYIIALQSFQSAGPAGIRAPDDTTLQLLNQVWKQKDIIPRVRTFAWRLLRKALPSGSRVASRSKHVQGLCSRCGLQEDDRHLFFTCTFARAAWFQEPWFIRPDIITENSPSLAHMLKNMLSLNHPFMKLTNLLTFLWCLWKSRNESLFCRKESHPHQIIMATRALLQDNPYKEITTPPIHQKALSLPMSTQTQSVTQRPSRIFVDAAWKKDTSTSTNVAGIGVFMTWNQDHVISDIFLQALSPGVSSALQAEAEGLLLAAKVIHYLGIKEAEVYTDNSILARALEAKSSSDSVVPWSIRHYIADIASLLTSATSVLQHVPRDLNILAHSCAP